MNLYLVKQDKNKEYDSFDSMVVVARTKESASKLHPVGSWEWRQDESPESLWANASDCWVSSPKDVDVILLGKAGQDYDYERVILASYNAG